jgi:hypothetical protein
MTTIEQFAIPQGWNITSWDVPSDPLGPIPSDGFAVGGTLLIGISANQSPACDLAWLNSESKQCSMPNLPFLDSELKGSVRVSFGGVIVPCIATLSLEGDVLTGVLTVAFGDGNTGTFVADANPPQADRPSKRTRTEELELVSARR